MHHPPRHAGPPQPGLHALVPLPQPGLVQRRGQHRARARLPHQAQEGPQRGARVGLQEHQVTAQKLQSPLETRQGLVEPVPTWEVRGNQRVTHILNVKGETLNHQV